MALEAKQYDSPNGKIGVNVIGLGPAGAGVAVASDSLGRFDQLHQYGVNYIDQSNVGETGRLGYGILSNSPGGDFLEVVRPDGKFESVLQSEIGQLLQRHEYEEIPLVQANEFHNQIVLALQDVLDSEEYPNSNIYSQTLIDHVIIEELKKGGYTLRAVAQDQEFQSESLVLATGAKGELIPQLKPYEEKVYLADDVLYDDNLIQNIRKKSQQGNQQVDIIGGSHSLGSLLWKLIRSEYNPENGTSLKDTKITAHYISDFKFFYNTEAEAKDDGFKYDAIEDVCPDTGRVFRFGGVRGAYKKLLQNIIKQLDETGGYKDEYGNEVILHQYDGDIVALNQTLKNSDAIIQAVGLKSKEIPIYYQSAQGGEKQKMDYSKDAYGNFIVDESGRMYSKNGNKKVVIPRVYGTGFGKVPKTTGGVGEPSFKFGPEGVNVYQGVHGKNLVKELLNVCKQTRHQFQKFTPVQISTL